MEQYYLPILETETGNGLSLSAGLFMIRVKTIFTCSNPQSLEYRISTVATGFDRLIAMGLIDLYEEEAGITIQLQHAPLGRRTIFSNAVFKRLLEKKIGEKAVEICPSTLF